MNQRKLHIHSGLFAVCRFESNSPLPEMDQLGDFWSISKTKQEISLIVRENYVKSTWKAEQGWRLLQISEILEFSLTGILESLLNPLAKAKISIFALSTYDTDYILLKNEDFGKAIMILKQSGFEFVE